MAASFSSGGDIEELLSIMLHSNHRTISGDVILKQRNYTSSEEYCPETTEL